MPRLTIQTDLADYQPLAEEADEKGITPLEVIQSVWKLGLAAHAAQRPRRESIDRLVTDPPLVAA